MNKDEEDANTEPDTTSENHLLLQIQGGQSQSQFQRQKRGRQILAAHACSSLIFPCCLIDWFENGEQKRREARLKVLVYIVEACWTVSSKGLEIQIVFYKVPSPFPQYSSVLGRNRASVWNHVQVGRVMMDVVSWDRCCCLRGFLIFSSEKDALQIFKHELTANVPGPCILLPQLSEVDRSGAWKLKVASWFPGLQLAI